MRRILALAFVTAAFAAPAAQAAAPDVVGCTIKHNNIDPEYGGRNYIDIPATILCIQGG